MTFLNISLATLQYFKNTKVITSISIAIVMMMMSEWIGYYIGILFVFVIEIAVVVHGISLNVIQY